MLDGDKISTLGAAKLVGVSKETLLRWFREGRVADVVDRDRNGWRNFSPDDIRRLQAFAAGGNADDAAAIDLIL